jgi:hypothetical protein
MDFFEKTLAYSFESFVIGSVLGATKTLSTTTNVTPSLHENIPYELVANNAAKHGVNKTFFYIFYILYFINMQT